MDFKKFYTFQCKLQPMRCYTQSGGSFIQKYKNIKYKKYDSC